MKTLIINAHPDPHSTYSATNRMVKHLLTKLPVGSTEIVNLAETKQPSERRSIQSGAAPRHRLSNVQLRYSSAPERLD